MVIKDTLSGGDPRTLKGVDVVIKAVLKNRKKLDELFECLFVKDVIIRMRASDALEKICKLHPDWLEPFINRLLNEVSNIDQPSVRWHLAQMLAEIDLNESHAHQAVIILKYNLETSDDWIVANLTIESLATFVRKGYFSRDEFVDILKREQKNSHKSVVSRANKLLKEFSG